MIVKCLPAYTERGLTPLVLVAGQDYYRTKYRRGPTNMKWKLSMLCGLALSLCAATDADAKDMTGMCFLKVGRKIYLNTRCSIYIQDYSDFEGGRFSIFGRDRGSFQIYKVSRRYGARVDIIGEDVGRAFWTGLEGSSKIEDPLGFVFRNGACWSNKRVRICASR